MISGIRKCRVLLTFGTVTHSKPSYTVTAEQTTTCSSKYRRSSSIMALTKLYGCPGMVVMATLRWMSNLWTSRVPSGMFCQLVIMGELLCRTVPYYDLVYFFTTSVRESCNQRVVCMICHNTCCYQRCPSTLSIENVPLNHVLISILFLRFHILFLDRSLITS